jgi:hypothetical protein
MELASPLLVNMMAITAMLIGLVIVAWWIIALYWMHTRDVEGRLPQVNLPADLHEVLTGIPLALTIFYIFIALSLAGYVLYIWKGGISY